MDKIITIIRPHNAGKLIDELTRGVPGLEPRLRADGLLEAVFTLTSRGDLLEIGVPASVDEMAIQSVIDAHDPTPPPPPPNPQQELEAAIATVRAKAENAGDTLLVELCDALLGGYGRRGKAAGKPT